jgi:tetratricopeptide (TPR) repeat protein
MRCSNCGQENGDNVKFCSNCGKKIELNKGEQRNSQENKTSHKKLYFGLSIVIVLILVGIGSFFGTKIIIVKNNTKLGNQYIEQGKYKEALPLFTKNVSINNKHIPSYLKLGEIYLNLGKYDDAKTAFKNAMELEPKKEEDYLKIKDLYLGKERLDDAFYFMKLAKQNGISSSTIEKALDSIRKSFKVTNLEYSVVQNSKFELPKEVEISVGDDKVKDSVKWKTNNVKTNSVGVYTASGVTETLERPVNLTLTVTAVISYVKDLNYSIMQNDQFKLPEQVDCNLSDGTTKKLSIVWEVKGIDTSIVGEQTISGTIEGYDKKVKLTIDIVKKEVLTTSMTGLINSAYTKDGKRMITFDDVLFLTGNEAIKAAVEEGNAARDEKGYYVPNDYYTVNKAKGFKEYEISNDATFAMLGYELKAQGVGAAEQVNCSYDQFKNNLKMNRYFDIVIKDNKVISIKAKYTP